MKFVHIADTHFDMPFVQLKGKKNLIKKKQIEQKFAFTKVIDYIKENNIDILFFAGDLFELKSVEEDTINFLISSFKGIPDTKVYITPGNHDPLTKNSPYNTYEWPENVFIFSSEVGVDEIGDVVIYGLGFTDYEMISDEIKNIKVDENKINILITHATLNGNSKKYNDVKESDLNKFDYVALGHIHLPKVDESGIIYPGSLTSGGFDELGEHGMVIGKINENRNETNIISYKFVPIKEMQFEIINLDISNYNSIQEIINEIKLQDNIYRIVLTGTRNVDVEELKSKIKVLSENIVDIKDETKISIDLKKLAEEKNLKGVFVKNMLAKANEDKENEDKYLKAIEYVLKGN